MPPVRPMLATSVKGIPDPAKYAVDGVAGLSFEPKWDGFRCLVFKDGDQVELASPNTKPLTRYFPRGRPGWRLAAGFTGRPPGCAICGRRSGPPES